MTAPLLPSRACASARPVPPDVADLILRARGIGADSWSDNLPLSAQEVGFGVSKRRLFLTAVRGANRGWRLSREDHNTNVPKPE